MAGGAIAAIAVVIVVAAFVLAPLLRTPRNVLHDESAEGLSRARELESRREMLLASLRDLEDDHDTEKVGEDDYHRIHSRLSAEAIGVMRELDELEARRDQAAAEAESRHTLRYPGPRDSEPTA